MTRRALLGAWLGGAITRLNNGLFRSALAGQANAILLAPGLDPLEHRTLRIDERRREPRFCHAVRLEGLVVANLHATNDFQPPAGRVGGGRARRGVRDRRRRQPSPASSPATSTCAPSTCWSSPGWSARGPGIDHVLVRGLSASPLAVWPVERRRHNGAVLSDHAPVEVTIG